ncbi:MAG: exonuclease domain-containing protein [Anaerolineae bacterium]
MSNGNVARWPSFFRRPAPRPDFVQVYLDAPRPDGDQPWRQAPYTVLDLELSGLDTRRDAILAIGLIDIEHGRIRLESAWQTLVQPPAGMAVASESIRIHGLMRTDLAKAPPLAEVLPALLERLRGRVLVVHVAAIDIAFLHRAMRQAYHVGLRGPAVDTARLAATLHYYRRFSRGSAEQPPTVSLRALAEEANLPVYAEHDALNDAVTTAQVFLALATRLERHGVASLHSLVRAGECVR